MVLEKTLESPLDCKGIKPVNPKGNQSWIFIGRTDAEVEAPILWPPDAKNWLTGKDPDAGKDWRQEEKGMTKDEIVGWHHRLNGREFEQALGVGDRQGSLAYFSPWGLQSMESRPPCPSPNPGVYSNSSPLSQWCHPAISSSVVPFSSCLQSFPASVSFPMSQFFVWGGQSIGVSASTSVLPMNTQDWCPLGWTGWISLQSKVLVQSIL